MATINTSQCKNCPHGTVDYSDKAKVTVYCDKKERTFYYGQHIQCDKQIKKGDK